ncbi:MAG TPA: S8 family serine peptidase [Thermoguttaceae bacterium]|nr:S8 family serine peptidase [Thermoguttaceae bacterium]
MLARKFDVVSVVFMAIAFFVVETSSASAEWRIPVTQPDSITRITEDLETPQEDWPGLPDAPLLADSLPAIGIPAMRAAYPFITGAGQTVAVIDTGIDYNHPALSGRYVTGWDFANNDSNPMDYNGHGTHVAGIVASTNATYGGVAPGAGIISLKVFSDAGGSASDANITAALNWVAANAATYNITTVNMSIGNSAEWTESDVSSGWAREQAMANLKNAGIFLACASGNEGYIDGISYPAVSPNAVSVGGTWASNDWSGHLISWNDSYTYGGQPAIMADNGPNQDDIMVISNRYRTTTEGELDLLAPGAMIVSSIPTSLDTVDGNQDGWATKTGTSMASPHVAGAAVLVRQALELAGQLDPNPADQVDQILGILQDTGVSLWDKYVSYGGNNCNIVQIPAGTGSWYIRPSTEEHFRRIDLDAAIASIHPIPEPSVFVTLAVGLLIGVLRFRRR